MCHRQEIGQLAAIRIKWSLTPHLSVGDRCSSFLNDKMWHDITYWQSQQCCWGQDREYICGNITDGKVVNSCYCLSPCVNIALTLLNRVFLVSFKTGGIFFISPFLIEDISIMLVHTYWSQLAWASSRSYSADLQRVLSCFCCSCTTVTWKQSQHSSFPYLPLPGSLEQHHPNYSSLCLPSPRRIKGPSSCMASAPYFWGTSLGAWFLARSCTVSCQGMNISGCCSFWLVILTAVNAISLSQISLKVLHHGGWFLLWFNTLCPPVNRAAACQSWEFYAFRSCLRVGMFGTDEIQPKWINSHCF